MRKVIIFFEFGRLGNQLFQYVGLQSFDDNARLFLIGMDSLKEVVVDERLFPKSLLDLLAYSVIKYLGKIFFYRLAFKFRLIGIIEEDKKTSYGFFKTKKGIIPGIFILKTSYFQNENILNNFFSERTLFLNQNFQKEAKSFIENLNINKKNLYFLHVRRGDYASWPDLESNALLPIDWYKKQMKSICSMNPGATFLVTGDDFDFLNDNFSKFKNCILGKRKPVLDFFLMIECQAGGILSPSSFALFAAFLNRLRHQSDSIFIAPLYWGGFNRRAWYPSDIQMSWITYNEV